MTQLYVFFSAVPPELHTLFMVHKYTRHPSESTCFYHPIFFIVKILGVRVSSPTLPVSGLYDYRGQVFHIMDLIDALTRNQSLSALSKYMRHAQRLYQWLIQPIVAELKPLS